jgi:hypothetical protein
VITYLVNLKYSNCDVKIDRTSKWGNPFVIGKDGDRDEVINKYRSYLLSNDKLMSKLETLRGKVLGCW